MPRVITLPSQGILVAAATMAELTDHASAEALLVHDPYSRAGLYDSLEVHTWRFGGRPKE